MEVTLDVDGEPGRAGAFVEIDFATMDQRRLAAKVARHRDYASDRAWWNRHPGCPALLLLTTSDARVTRFLANLERARPRPSYYGDEDPTAWEPVVAACACVSAPEEALSAPVWRTSAADAPSTLSSLLSADVRTYRRLVATVRAQRAADEQYRRLQAIHPLAADSERLADAMDDDEAAAAVRFLFDQVLPYNPSVKEEWAAQHLDLVTTTHAWWVDGDGRSGWPPPPAQVVSGWRALYRSMWAEQATRLLDRAAESANDPRLRRPAADLAAGTLVRAWRLEREPGPDARSAAAEAALDYEARRDAAVADALRALPLHRRLATSRAALEADYDAQHLVVCVDCAIVRHDDPEQRRYGGPARCPLCDGELVADPAVPGAPARARGLAGTRGRAAWSHRKRAPVSHAASQHAENRPTGAGDTQNAAPAQRLHHPRGRGTERRGTTPDPECGPPDDPRHPRGEDVARSAVPHMRGTRLTWSPAIREVGTEPAARRPRPRRCGRWPGRSSPWPSRSAPRALLWADREV